jgi:hypothetical protein
LIEEELVGLTEPNLTVKIATNLASVLIGTKVTIEDFSFKVRYLFGDTINILGTEDEPKDYQGLSLIDKFDVLYNLIFQLQYIETFKKQVEKYEKENELRFEPIFEHYVGDGELESYFLLSDNRIYKQKLFNFPEVKIPRKYKNSKNFNPEEELNDIEPESEWECIAIGIYQIHDFLESIKSVKKLKPLFQNLKEHINDLALEDLTNRKKIVKRKREQQLNELVSNRKRSSRLQEREEQLKIEQEERAAQYEIQKQEQAKIKAARNLKKKENRLRSEIEDRLRKQTVARRGEIITASDFAKPDLEPIELGEGDWLFECGCGLREKNYDDGVKLIVCERCQRWQHLKCQSRIVQQELVRNSNEVFICDWCKHDLEVEVSKKLDDEKIRLEKEAEEKLRQKELQKKRKLEEAQRLEEEEKLRKEEVEKERQRRILEREKLKENSAGPLNSSPASSQPTNGHHSFSGVPNVNIPKSTTAYQQPGPAFGTFQVSPQSQFQQNVRPSFQGSPSQSQPQSQPQPQPQPHFQPTPPQTQFQQSPPQSQFQVTPTPSQAVFQQSPPQAQFQQSLPQQPQFQHASQQIQQHVQQHSSPVQHIEQQIHHQQQQFPPLQVPNNVYPPQPQFNPISSQQQPQFQSNGNYQPHPNSGQPQNGFNAQNPQ